jgi:hypothetical protein
LLANMRIPAVIRLEMVLFMALVLGRKLHT